MQSELQSSADEHFAFPNKHNYLSDFLLKPAGDVADLLKRGGKEETSGSLLTASSAQNEVCAELQ